MKQIFFLFIISSLLVQCKTDASNVNKSKDSINKVELAASIKKFEADISGMTCEIGCARLIESKVSKMKGVTSVNVNFEAKKGTFSYNENVVTESEIISEINKIADGNLYKVEKIKQSD